MQLEIKYQAEEERRWKHKFKKSKYNNANAVSDKHII